MMNSRLQIPCYTKSVPPKGRHRHSDSPMHYLRSMTRKQILIFQFSFFSNAAWVSRHCIVHTWVPRPFSMVARCTANVWMIDSQSKLHHQTTLHCSSGELRPKLTIPSLGLSKASFLCVLLSPTFFFTYTNPLVRVQQSHPSRPT
jgi:hypothetical protein